MAFFHVVIVPKMPYWLTFVRFKFEKLVGMAFENG